MAVGVEHDADLLLRLMVGEHGALLNSPRRCGLEVLHPDVEVLRCWFASVQRSATPVGGTTGLNWKLRVNPAFDSTAAPATDETTIVDVPAGRRHFAFELGVSAVLPVGASRRLQAIPCCPWFSVHSARGSSSARRGGLAPGKRVVVIRRLGRGAGNREAW